MVTDIRQFATVLGSSLAEQAEGRLVRWVRQVNRVICAARGHEELLQFETNRLYLRCISCGAESAGWSVGTANRAPVVPLMTAERSTSGSDSSGRRAA